MDDAYDADLRAAEAARPEDQFLLAVLLGDEAEVARWLEADRSIVRAASRDEFGRGIPIGSTCLHLAVRYGHAALVDTLLAAGAPLDVRNREGRAPLHDALVYEHSLRGRLIDAGAPIDAGQAAFLDWVDRVRDLVLADPSSLHDKRTGLAPLAWAAYGNAARSARVLLDLGARLGEGELSCAAQVGGVKVGRLLLERGADPNERHQGFNALHAALTTPFTSELLPFVTLLLEYGADVNWPTAAGQRPLDLVALACTSAGSPARAASLAACDVLLRRHGAQADARRA